MKFFMIVHRIMARDDVFRSLCIFALPELNILLIPRYILLYIAYSKYNELDVNLYLAVSRRYFKK